MWKSKSGSDRLQYASLSVSRSHCSSAAVHAAPHGATLERAAMANRQLAVATISFAVCFAAWGLISAFATRFRDLYHLSASQTALLVAVPVLLGSLARLPMGLATDRFKGRIVFTVLMLCSAIPAFLVPTMSSYTGMLVMAFLLGSSRWAKHGAESRLR